MSDTYDATYLGSGKIIKLAIKKYGKENFSNTILYKANTLEELNLAESFYIGLYKEILGEKLYNLASGGDGGNVFKYASASEKEAFKLKMQKINKERCTSIDFKQKISRATTKRFEDIEERRRQSEKIKIAWSNPDLIQQQRERILKYYSEHKKDNSYLHKPCILEFENKRYEFDSRKKLDAFLKQEFNLVLSRKLETELLLTEKPYRPFHKNRLKKFIGMRIYYKQQNENVETIGDECSQVGYEIGTYSKCKTEIEDIVHPA